METSIGRTNQARRSTGGRRSRGHSDALTRREKRRLWQLLVSVALFLVVFLGKGFLPTELSQRVLQTIRSDTDFKTVFSGLGQALSKKEPVLDTIGNLWVELLGRSQVTADGTDLENAPVFQREIDRLASGNVLVVIPDIDRQTGGGASGVITESSANGTAPAASGNGTAAAASVLSSTDGLSQSAAQSQAYANSTAAAEQVTPAARVEALVASVSGKTGGETLPAGCLDERIDLELGKTVSPVLAAVSSSYGYREHPIDGKEKFHYGVDLAADLGTTVKAFADGAVDFVGKSQIYGNYLQLKHANGITTFYAHLSKVCVTDGQKVKAGDKIALSGQSGEVTGPHLHFEVRCNGIYLNPADYISTL